MMYIIFEMSHVCTLREPPCASNRATVLITGATLSRWFETVLQ